MTRFCIEVSFASEVALGLDTFWTLDAIAWGLIDQRRALDRYSDIAIPIENDADLPLASSVAFVGETYTELTKIGAIRGVKDSEGASQRFRSVRGKLSKIRTANGPTKAHLTRFILISAPIARWIGVGDPDVLLKLIEDAGSLGARKAEGFGRIRSVKWTETDEDPLIDREGRARRPIPINHPAARRLSNSSIQGVSSWRAPYWDASDARVCHLPRGWRQ